MVKYKLLAVFLIVIAVTSSDCFSQNSQIDYYSPQNIYSFAEHLYQNDDYLRAAGEFQRYLFNSNLHANDSVIFRIGLCYELADKPEAARNYYRKIISDCPNSNFHDAAHYQIAHTYFSLNENRKSIEYIDENISVMSTDSGQCKMQILAGANYLYEKKWSTTNSYFSSLLNNKNQYNNKSTITSLCNISAKGKELPYKSKMTAGLLSTVIPGMGKIYAGRSNDGLYSFITIGLTAWQAYDGFHENGTHSVKGWIYGTVSSIFYLGNIYGSMVAIKIYNEKLDDDLVKQFNVNLIWSNNK
jgi:tetratricopeptide (TPR) repeat protein